MWLSCWSTCLCPGFNLATVNLRWSWKIYPYCAMHPCHSIMLPLPCLTGTVFLGGKGSEWLIQTDVLSLWPQSSVLVSSDRKTVPQKAFGLSSCAAAIFYWVWRRCFKSRSFFLGWDPLSPRWCKLGPTSLSVVLQQFAFSPRQAWALVVPGLSLSVLTSFISSESDTKVMINPTSVVEPTDFINWS